VPLWLQLGQLPEQLPLLQLALALQPLAHQQPPPQWYEKPTPELARQMMSSRLIAGGAAEAEAQRTEISVAASGAANSRNRRRLMTPT